MSWAGIIRPSNEFTPAIKSRFAVMTAESDMPLRRYLGKWDSTYSRFTSNLTSSEIKVRAVATDEVPGDGIQCILHWVDRRDILRSDSGSVCQVDGWPKELWEVFTSELENLPEGTFG